MTPTSCTRWSTGSVLSNGSRFDNSAYLAMLEPSILLAAHHHGLTDADGQIGDHRQG
jgi:hypothetical protein